MCVCEGEAEDHNKDGKERRVRERARNGEDGNDDDREEERLYVCVCEGETGDQNKDAKPKGVRERASSCSSNRRKREGNPDDLKLRI